MIRLNILQRWSGWTLLPTSQMNINPDFPDEHYSRLPRWTFSDGQPGWTFSDGLQGRTSLPTSRVTHSSTENQDNHHSRQPRWLSLHHNHIIILYLVWRSFPVAPSPIDDQANVYSHIPIPRYLEPRPTIIPRSLISREILSNHPSRPTSDGRIPSSPSPFSVTD